jgi:Protein of unknown function (DUF993)
VTTLRLPDGTRYTVGPAPDWPTAFAPPRLRRVYAAARVVARPTRPAQRSTGVRPVNGYALGGGASPADAGSEVDWQETMAVRHRLWALGFGVADAMDTAQRGMGLGWDLAAELIRRSAREAATVGGAIACGAGTDQLDPATRPGRSDVLAAYREQLEVVEGSGATAIVMASRALAATARGPGDYLTVYGTLLSEVSSPVILHWLGPMFDPALEGYWGSSDLDRASETVLDLIAAYPKRIDGIKVSLLDMDREVRLRRRLPPSVRLYTGDDFHYPELILGDGHRHSDALLGIFDAIARPAAAALSWLDEGDTDGYLAAMLPTVPLARHIFEAPTFHYKTGLAFLAWLNGDQSHFRMLGGHERCRDAAHLAKLFVLADQARVLVDPELAVRRLESYLGAAV